MAFQCLYCQKTFTRKDSLQRHLLLHTKLHQFTCDKCDKTFTRKDLFDAHTRHHNAPKFKCDKCDKTFTTKSNLENHMKRHDTQFNCNVCGKVFYRRDVFEQHTHNQVGGARKRPPPGPLAGPPMKKLNENVKENYTISKVNEAFMDKFQAQSTTYKVKIHDVTVRDIAYILETFHKLFDSLLQDITANANDNDFIHLSIQTPQLDYPIQLPFTKKIDLRVSRILDEIERVLQSDEEFILDDGVEIEVIHVHNPNGGRNRQGYVNLDRFLMNKKCIIRIQNVDDLCCARAIITAKAKIDQHNQWDSIRRGYNIQGDLAKELHT